MSGKLWRATTLVVKAGPGEATVLLVLGLCAGGCTVPAAWLMKLLVDGLSAHTLSHGQVVALAAGAVLLGVFGTLLVHVAAIASASLEAKTKLHVEMQLARAASRQDGTQFLELPGRHDELHMARRSPELMAGTVPPAVIEVTSSVAAFVGYGAVLWVSWPLVVLALVLVAVPSAFLQHRIDRSATDLVRQSSSEYRWHDYYSRLFFDPATARDMRLHGAQGFFLRRLHSSLNNALRSEVRGQVRVAWSRACIGLAQGIIAAVGTAFVATAVYRGSITVGELVLFVAAVTIVQARMASLLGLTAEVSLTLAAFSSLESFVGESALTQRANPRGLAIAKEEVSSLRHGVTFSDVWFRYTSDSPWVLRGTSFTLRAGELCGLVGLNGSGKSTIVRLLLRYAEPKRGTITWDGVDIRRYSPEAYRRHITGVLQDRVHYELSLGDNVWLGDLDRHGDVEALSTSLTEVGLDKVAADKRLDPTSMLSPTRRGDDGGSGTELSGGEWERVALARVVMADQAELEILDEPNAGLDIVAETLLRQRIRNRADCRTRLVVSHRPGTLNAADQILVVDGGRIAECGTHEELSRAKGLYAKLLDSSASTELPDSYADLLHG